MFHRLKQQAARNYAQKRKTYIYTGQLFCMWKWHKFQPCKWASCISFHIFCRADLEINRQTFVQFFGLEKGIQKYYIPSILHNSILHSSTLSCSSTTLLLQRIIQKKSIINECFYIFRQTQLRDRQKHFKLMQNISHLLFKKLKAAENKIKLATHYKEILNCIHCPFMCPTKIILQQNWLLWVQLYSQ